MAPTRQPPVITCNHRADGITRQTADLPLALTSSMLEAILDSVEQGRTAPAMLLEPLANYPEADTGTRLLHPLARIDP